MKPFISVIIKPTLDCNIDCRHCYHTKEERSKDTMPLETVEKLFDLVSKEYESVWFIWHGGEPLLMPLRFYKDAMRLQEKHFGKDSHRVGNTIQTNGTLLDKRFMNFCRDSKISIGVSFEGPCNHVLRESTKDVEKALNTLVSKEHVFSASSTISSETVSDQKEIYEAFRDRNISVSFSPVIPAGCAASCKELVPDPEEYIRASIEAFDLWIRDTDTKIPLIPHYLYLLNALGEPTESDCAHTSCLTKWLCIYPNGDLYPCGKGCPKDFMLGNIKDMDRISQAFASEGFERIISGTVKRRDGCISECDLFRYCNGGCSIDAYYECGIGCNGGDSCLIFKGIFTHILETVNSITGEKKDLSQYNRFVRDAVMDKLINPKVTKFVTQ